jgi:hypothetical protein
MLESFFSAFHIPRHARCYMQPAPWPGKTTVSILQELGTPIVSNLKIARRRPRDQRWRSAEREAAKNLKFNARKLRAAHRQARCRVRARLRLAPEVVASCWPIPE